ncbi:MAG: ABC transporter substrate-binding protein [Candidatus Lokiarchaeota archaeon]|nr:ABC transporter substrate-binding protein [Candidatus Harpocratesius repetitus]
MISRKSMVFLILGIVMVAGIGIGIYYYDQNNADVRIGYLEGDLHQLAFYVAREQGLYQQENIKIQSVAFSNGGDVMTAFEASNRGIDMAYFGFAPALFHRFTNQAANITILAGVNVNGSALIVKNDPNIQTGEDLKGLTIAVPSRHNMQDFILSMILNQSGLTYADINLTVGMAPSNMVLALQEGSIDGYIAWEPYCIKGTENNIGKYLYRSSDVWPNHPCCIIASYNDFLNSDISTVKKVLKVHKEATEWILNNWNEAKQIAMDKMNLSEEQAALAMANIGYVYQMDLAQMELFVQKLVNLNDLISLDSPNIPSGSTTTTFIKWFVDPSILASV